MEDFGICRVKNMAFYQSLAVAVPLPADYVGDFAEPSRSSDCCAVMRDTGKPRRCRSRRRLWNGKTPEKAAQCCQAHRGREGKALAWRAGLAALVALGSAEAHP